MRMRDLRGLVDSTKSFDHPVVGDPTLNTLGLHLARIAAADALFWGRRAVTGGTSALQREGIVVVPDFLASEEFEQVQSEVRQALARAAEVVPHPKPDGVGFGQRQPFDGGFDRFDGHALNRFLHIGEAMPATAAFVAKRLAPFCASEGGSRPKPNKFAIQELIHSCDAPDLQKVFHRDTFHQALKAWFFIEPATLSDGPFEYVRRSHRMTRARAEWEYRCSVRAAKSNGGGAFRITEEELAELSLTAEPCPVAANTLVIANIRGFHRRGSPDHTNARRVAIHASLRPSPFVPFPY